MENGRSPPTGKDATIEVLHKKNDRSDCNNYRGVSLVAHSGKVLLKMVASCLATSTRPRGYSQQDSAVFAQHVRQSTCCSSCTDCKNSDERGKSPLYMCFIDLEKAHGSVGRELLGVVLARFGAPEKMLTVIRQFHEGMRARVRADDGEHSE